MCWLFRNAPIVAFLTMPPTKLTRFASGRVPGFDGGFGKSSESTASTVKPYTAFSLWNPITSTSPTVLGKSWCVLTVTSTPLESNALHPISLIVSPPYARSQPPPSGAPLPLFLDVQSRYVTSRQSNADLYESRLAPSTSHPWYLRPCPSSA